MNLAEWAERGGVARVTAYRWMRAGPYSKRAAQNRGKRALAVTAKDAEAA